MDSRLALVTIPTTTKFLESLPAQGDMPECCRIDLAIMPFVYSAPIHATWHWFVSPLVPCLLRTRCPNHGRIHRLVW